MAYRRETKELSRNDILDKSKSIINGERQGTYGDAEDSFQIIANLWSAYLNEDILAEDVANMMILLKVARNSNGVYKDDNWIDICGYAALGGEIQAKKQKDCNSSTDKIDKGIYNKDIMEAERE